MCEHHLQLYLKKYTSNVASKLCSNPLLHHVKNRRGTTIITLALVDAYAAVALVPGERICEDCRRLLYQSSENTHAPPAEDGNALSEEHLAFPATSLQAINGALLALGESPMRAKRAKKRRMPYAQTKLQRLQKRAAKAIDVSLGLDKPATYGQQTNEHFELSDYVVLMNEVKRKFNDENNREKRIQFLTLAPNSWSREKIMTFFGASEREVREAVKVKAAEGILGTRPKRQGRVMSEAITSSIVQFFEDDSVSYCLPGRKDVLNGRQKRLLLMNLKEMHHEWKRTYNLKCGFSTFASLRPAHCVLAGASGTHTVC